MTIVEAIKEVLAQNKNGLTSKEIYESIITNNLYVFPAKNPASVVNSQIRRHCQGLDFPTANLIKHFKIVRYSGKRPCYALIDDINPIVSSEPKAVPASELLPEEIIMNAYRIHIKELKNSLLELIMANQPEFFEHLVVELLIKMGYGCDENAGNVVGGSHDGGIDGIISEDRLGLDIIHLQAKRYKKDCHVGRKELQAFVGAMQSVHKGVFITTSSFTKEAQKYATEQQQKSLKLIDGDFLTSLLIKYEVGIFSEDVFKIYKIDMSYFN